MSDSLPPLPGPALTHAGECPERGHWYSAAQMHAYAIAALAAPAGCVADEDAAIGRVVKWQLATRMTMQNDRKRANPAQIHTDTTLNLLQQIIADARLAAAPKVSTPQADPAPAVANPDEFMALAQLSEGRLKRAEAAEQRAEALAGVLRFLRDRFGLHMDASDRAAIDALLGQATPEGAS